MTRSELLAYCLSKPGAWRDEPWPGDEVAKVAEKIFVFLGSADADPPVMMVKCGRNADEARELRDQYPGLATIAPYVGRSGWNSVRLEGTIPDEEVRELVDASYGTVVSALPKRRRPPSA
jgi:predicted DNA-binding protein (MmcQ/YjbR family)